MSRALVSRFSTMNPMAEAKRAEEIRNVLDSVIEPYTNLPLKKLNWIKNIKPTERGVSFDMEMISNAYPKYDELSMACRDALRSLTWLNPMEVNINAKSQRPSAMVTDRHNKIENLQHVSNIIAVSSCKGGVGKSTIAVNLAFALQQMGGRVGILDCDIFGPSLPILLHHENDQILAYNEKTWLPFKLHDLLCMSFGWLSNNSSSAIMRGPMVMGIVEQILNNTLWGDLDYLILDLPPGTGDVQLSLCQKLSLSGSVIVTTPQILSLADTEKGIRMFSKLRVPVNAVVHNMAYFKCEHGTVYHPFGTVNQNALQKKFAIPNAFELPIDLALSKSDELPVMCEHPETPIADTFTNIAESIVRDMVRRRYIRKTEYEVSFKKDDGIVMRKISPTAAEEIKMSPRDLRLRCGCAKCVDEFTGKKLLKDSDVPMDVVPTNIDYEGNYGISVQWSDGHGTSVYPYDKMEKLFKEFQH